MLAGKEFREEAACRTQACSERAYLTRQATSHLPAMHIHCGIAGSGSFCSRLRVRRHCCRGLRGARTSGWNQSDVIIFKLIV
jgi:hypothetical protein